MTYFKESKILPYKAQDLFYLVLDVEKYSEFLPWCKASKIISNDQNCIIAELVINYKGFEDKYKSSITSNSSPQIGSYKINVEAISGPFKFLNNYWKFTDQDSGCLVEFMISFEFKNMLLDKIAGLFFKSAMEKTVASFEKRANEIKS